jgi:signal transduction histidine kinase
VRVSVRDNGAGIGEVERRRLFEPYFTTKPDGTGLGLFVTRQLVTQHGGTIEFRCPAEGGTEFTVSFPAAPLPIPAASPVRVETAPC